MKAIISLKDGRSIKIDLFREEAPISVDNFVMLARDNYYNGLIFHRVIKNFMIQGGGMNESMRPQGNAKSIKGEFKSNGVKNTLKHTTGTISMARTAVPDSASSQFFICVADTPHLDGDYAAFGRCTDEDSIKITKDISLVDVTQKDYHSDVPVNPIVIKDIQIFD